MASIQRFTSHGQPYYRIVESYRRPDGQPTVRTLVHLGKAEALLARLAGTNALRVASRSAGAVDALWRLAQEFDVPGVIDAAVTAAGDRPQRRDGLTVGQSLTVASVARLCRPQSKRAIAAWAAQTTLPTRAGVAAPALTSQHFWDQMDAVPLEAVAAIETTLVGRVLATEHVTPDLLAYDTTNFYTYLATPNTRSALAQRGHNKQRRHDLRQLGLALVVAAEDQLPLGHVLYPGARPDARTFAEELAPLRARLARLLGAAAQYTLVFDQGAETADTLARLRAHHDGYVTALKPSHHRAWLATVRAHLDPVTLRTGEVVEALRTRRAVHGIPHTVVVLYSAQLAEGQRRGLARDVAHALAALARIGPRPRGDVTARVRQILGRQYVRDVLSVTTRRTGDHVTLTPVVDEAARAALETQYFGLRVLATTHDDWTTAQIIEAYRGQAHVERAFRDLKDPWVGAFRPQFHWTDQKLVVHALLVMLGLLLGRVMLRRARQRVGFTGGLRRLIQSLGQIRESTVVHQHDGPGRPRVTTHVDTTDETLRPLAEALGAWPAADGPSGVYTTRRR
jgi:transposase